MQKHKVDLQYLMSGSGLSPSVADHIFGGVPDVEVDVLKTLATSELGSLANDVAALHATIEKRLQNAPDSEALRNFLALYIAHARHTENYLTQLLQQEKGRDNERNTKVDQGDS